MLPLPAGVCDRGGGAALEATRYRRHYARAGAPSPAPRFFPPPSHAFSLPRISPDWLTARVWGRPGRRSSRGFTTWMRSAAGTNRQPAGLVRDRTTAPPRPAPPRPALPCQHPCTASVPLLPAAPVRGAGGVPSAGVCAPTGVLRAHASPVAYAMSNRNQLLRHRCCAPPTPRHPGKPGESGVQYTALGGTCLASCSHSVGVSEYAEGLGYCAMVEHVRICAVRQ